MLVVRNKKGEVCLIADYEINYDLVMEEYGGTIIQKIKVPSRLRRCRKTKIVDIIEWKQEHIINLKLEVQRNEELIVFLNRVLSKAKKSKG